MKKVFSSILCLAFLFLFSLPSFAYDKADDCRENSGKYEEYLEYVERGIIDDTVSYEMWLEIIEHSRDVAIAFENNDDFYLVYEGPSLLATSVILQPGDIVLTNAANTSGAGIVGHAGIATASRSIFHIAGANHTPAYIGLSVWLSNYSAGDTHIYRCNNSSDGQRAATWATSTYAGTSTPYSISSDLLSTSSLYCSKLVWQAYYYGVGASSVYVPSYFTFVAPYDLPSYVHNTSLYTTIY